MNLKVQAYLAEKEREAQAAREDYRRKILIKAGLASKVYAPDNEQSQEYPLHDYDDEGRFYKIVVEEVTDEEFAQIESYVKSKAPEVPENEGMFKNIGGKICTCAWVFCWIGIAVSLLSGLSTMAQDSDALLAGLLIAVAGSLFSWITSLFLYGFGELIVKVTEIEKNTRK